MENNVYATPEAELIQVDSSSQRHELAGRWPRLFASLIDTLIAMVYILPFMFFVGPYLGFEFGQQPGLLYTVAGTIFGSLCFIIIHGHPIDKSGQTWGKKLLGIQVVDVEGELISAQKYIGMRFLPISIAASIPVIGQLLATIDILFIFGKEKRCIHDYIANTKVVKVNA